MAATSKNFEESFRQMMEPAYFKWVLIPRARANHHKKIREIKKRGYARVIFLVSSLPMWRFQHIYDRIALDNRFRLGVAIYPFPSFSPAEKSASMNSLRAYFSERAIPVHDLSGKPQPGSVLKNQLDPDILFYPQPYNYLYGNDLDSPYLADRLLCYIPYSIYMTNAPWVYKSFFNNVAWRLYYGSEFSKAFASQVLFNKCRNIRVVGEPMADFFREPPAQSVWKQQETVKKKVIWAPHFSIVDEGFHHRDSFTWLSETMWKMAVRYRDQIQFAFKPHPRLRSVLADLPGWGEEKTRMYYRQWAEGDNTQLEIGPYVELFKESDAMIHDCGSFSVEYHFTGKPVMFTTHDINKVVHDKNTVGKNGLLAHYVGQSEEDVRLFLENVVLNGKDPMKEQRERFRKDYLIPPGGETVAEAIYLDIIQGLNF